MSLRKRTSKDLEKAGKRLAGLKSIDENLDLSNGLSVAAYEAKIADAELKLETYNRMLSDVDGQQNELEDSEKELRDFTERMLAGVGATYGKDSDAYVKAGGVKKSERKRYRRRLAPVEAS